jgi:hypothetical protein
MISVVRLHRGNSQCLIIFCPWQNQGDLRVWVLKSYVSWNCFSNEQLRQLVDCFTLHVHGLTKVSKVFWLFKKVSQANGCWLSTGTWRYQGRFYCVYAYKVNKLSWFLFKNWIRLMMGLPIALLEGAFVSVYDSPKNYHYLCNY